jgi:hypothetical protein
VYLRGFVAWIVFACFPSDDVRTAALVALAVGASLIFQDLKRGIAPDALVLEGSTVAYLAAVSLVAHFSTGPGFSHWSGVFAFSWLALTAWATRSRAAGRSRSPLPARRPRRSIGTPPGSFTSTS